MSILGGIYPDPDRVIKKSSVHRRYDSGELDVFEAAHYFSGINESTNSSISTRKSMMRDDNDHDRRQQLGGGRISVDMAPMTMRHALLASHHYHQMCDSNKQRNITKERTKQKQPSSPGGKLASFLNSLFTRQTLLRDTAEKKKKKKSSSSSAAAAQAIKDEEESPGGTARWRRRRSSISHFRSTSTGNSTSASSSAAGIIEYSKSMFSSSSSSVRGFRTPPPYVSTPSFKDNFRTNNYSDHKQLVPSTNISKYGITKTSSRSSTANNFDWLDEKLIKFTSNGLSSTKSKLQNNSSHDSCTKARSTCSSSKVMDRYRGATAADDQAAEKKEIIKRFNQVDDEGEDSDSSSDLFELQLNDYDNLGSGYCSSGLPVYETTHMDNIKRSSATPITNGPVRN